MHFHSQRRSPRVRSPGTPCLPGRAESPLADALMQRVPQVLAIPPDRTGGFASTWGTRRSRPGPGQGRGAGAGAGGQRAATLPAMRFEVRATSFSSGPWPTARCHATARRPNTATCIQNQNPGCSS